MLLIFFCKKLFRKRVHLPSALEATNVDISCLSSGKPNFVSFLAQYGARQIKEKNTLKGGITIFYLHNPNLFSKLY